MTLADTVMKAMGPRFLHRALLVLCLVLFTSLFFAGASSAEVVISAHTDAPDPVAAHGIVTYTIVVSNNTFEVPFSNVTVTDIIPATTQFVDVTPPASVSCAGVFPGETGTLTCTGLSLAAAGDPGDSVTYLVRVRTTSASRAAGTITNSATANDHVNTPFTQTQSTTVNAGSDIALTKSASPSPVIAGGVVAYTLTLSNNGPDPASTLVITDTLPPNCSVTGSLPTGCTSSGQTITCNVAALGYPGTTNVGPIQCITGVAGGSTLTNTASVTVGAASPDNLTDNNTTSVDTPVAAGSDVSITKTKSLADPVFTGISFDFVLTTRYSGDFPTGATLTDVVPAQFTINNPASFSQNGWDCTVSGQTVNCTRTGSGSAGINQALGVVNINVTAITAVASTSNTTSISPPPGVTDPTPGNNTSTLTFQVLLYQADFSSTKTRTVPNSVAQNLPFEFTLAARNNGPASFTGTVTLTDTLPVGFRLNSYSTASGFTAANCIPASASLPVDGPVTITCTRNVTNLAANTSAGSIVINVTPTGTGDLTNGVCVSTSGLGPADGNSGNNCVSNTVTSQIDPNQADIRVNKTASPATVDAGQPLTYIVEVVNAGPNTAQDVQLTDVLADLINGTIGASQGVEAQPDIDIHGGGAVIPASGSATCRIVSTGGTSARLDCTITTLPVCTAGSDCPTFTFVIRPAASANPNNNDLARTNTATAISQVTADPNLGNNSGSVTSNVSPRADMTVTKTDLPDPAPAGQQLAYTITARNNGPSTAYGVSITDTLPLDVTYVSASASNGGSCTTTPAANSTTAAGNRTLSCSWATGFGRNVQRTVSVVVRPNYITHGTQLTNDVSVATTTTETNAGNNTGQALTNVSGPVYDLLINNTDTPDPVTVGDDVTYTITVTNNGASFAENVRMVDTLPAAGLSFRSVIPITAGVTCSSTAVVGAIGGTVTCDIPGLATAASAQMQVVLRGENKGTYTNSAQARFQDATADAFDPQSNNTATQPTTVRTRADVQVVSKQAVQSGTATPISQIELRHPFDWLVDVRNNGPAEADTVTFSDALPAGMELTGTPALTVTSGTFTPTAPTCTGTAGGTGFTCAITSMPAAGTASVRIPVRVITVPGSGSTTNRSTIVTTDSFDTNGGNNPNAGNNFSNGSVAVLSSALSGGVYRDNNDNGAVDAGENGIQGATITVTGTAFDSTPVSRTVLTDTSGNFSVTGLPDGFYNVTETNGNLPAGYVDGKDTLSGSAIGTVGNDTFTAISLAPNTTLSGYLFGETLDVTVSGSVFNDADTSGTISAGDTPISGVNMTLVGNNDRNQAVNCLTTTNGAGAFSFTTANCPNLRAADTTGYILTESQPSGYLPGTTLVGAASGTGSSAGTRVGGTTGDTIQGIILPPGGASINNTFLEVRPTTIAGYVYFDVNNNHVRDGGETVGVPGAALVLTGANDLGQSTNCTVASGPGGAYQFPNTADSNPLCQTIRPGTYTVTETIPPGLLSTGAQPGTPVNGTAGSTPTTQLVSNIVVTGTGGSLTNYNFGHQGTALGGSVYVDTNNNGLREVLEPGIPGVAVTLSGTAAAGGSVCNLMSSCIVVTDSSGYYSFSGVPGSDPNSTGYTITERDAGGNPSPVLSNYTDGIDSAGTVTPPGATSGTAGNDVINGIVITTGQVGANYNFGEIGGSLSGSVYIDANNDGNRQIGEIGIAGVMIVLSGTDVNGQPLNRTATTDSNGDYPFANLPAGTFTLTETQPAAYTDGKETPGAALVTGTVNNSAFGSLAATNQISSFTLTGGASATGYLFGERTANLSGFVYSDLNNNGIRETGEPGIAVNSITLTGTDADNAPVNMSVQTAADGSYGFSGLKLPNGGGFTITQTVAPAGYIDGMDQNGAGNMIPNSGGRPSPESMAVSPADFTAALTATQNAALFERDFGELQGAQISGRVYYDANNSSIYDTGEELANVTITLTGTDDLGNPVTVAATTAPDGTYSFPNLRPGTYTVTETQPNGIADYPGTAGTQVGTISGVTVGTAAQNIISAIVLASGNQAINYNFRENASGLSGHAYQDTNGNGTMDGGEIGIGGVTITLTGTDSANNPVSRTTTTDANGSYSFIGLTSGTYTITETQPVIYADGIDHVGSAGGTLGNDVISAIPLGAGVSGPGYDFGELNGLPGSFSGKVWYNSVTKDQTQQPGELGLSGWLVEAVQGGVVRGTATTAADGAWTIRGLPAGASYEIRFHHPGNNALYGIPVSQDPGYVDSIPDYNRFTIANMILRSGGNVVNQNLPVDPSGVVYDSITRAPVLNATVTITGPAGFDPVTQLLGGTANVSQVTGVDGFYQFLLLPGAPSGTYTLSITSPPGYVPGTSTIIPPVAGSYTPGSGIIQTQPTPPTGSQPTTYYLSFNIGPSLPHIVNNHIPVDPIISGAITVSKTTPLLNVTRGDLVPYTIRARNTLAANLPNIVLVDQVPPGFKYLSGSARLNGVAAEPAVAGRTLRWPALTFSPSEEKVITLVLVVGAGVGDGVYTNYAWAINSITGGMVSNQAEAAVRIVPDPTFDCSDIIGKVFNDRNANGYQDEREPGIPNVRLATAKGWLINTDAEGRFHVACAAIPQMDRGSNFIMKLDERTLPSGYRMTTENPRTVRLSRGKMAKINFGATIHRVVRVEVSDEAFQANSLDLKPEWAKHFADLPEQLKQKASVVRLAYRLTGGDRSLAEKRLDRLTQDLRGKWESLDCCYPLSIEEEFVEVSR